MPHAPLFAILLSVVAQEELTLPPACPLPPLAPLPGSPAAPFSLALSNGSTLSYPGLPLPLVAFALAGDDPGGLLTLTDALELDRLFSLPPATSTVLLLTYAPSGTGPLEALIDQRLGLLPAPRAAAWRACLAFARDSVPQLAAAGNTLASTLTAWASPRLWVAADGVLPAPGAARVDGFYECYRWPPARQAYTLYGPIAPCSSPVAAWANVSGLVLLTPDAPLCSPEEAVAWAQSAFPRAAGALLPSASPILLGRNCDDTFEDAPFFPAVIDTASGAALAAALAAAGAPGSSATLPIAFNYTCSEGTALAIGGDGSLSTLGWRKYTEASLLAWGVGELTHLQQLRQAEGGVGVVTVPLLPSRTSLRAAARNVTLPLPVSTLRGFASSALSLRLQCAEAGDGSCGPWDRIISATARCWEEGSGGGGGSTASVEVARWITPFRRSGGAWHSAGDALVGLIGNASQQAPDSGVWTCEIAVSTCCEDWLGQLDLLLFPPAARAGAAAAALGSPQASPSPLPSSLPFATLPFLFPNPATHFGPQFNLNRSTLLALPPAFSHARVFALITGHGSDPPPPVGLGCEYAPTEHVFLLGAPGGAPLVALNTSLVAPNQYLLAGSIFGCSDKVPLGVLGNQHGDWRDGRNGWCPGQGVAPVLSADIASALAGLPVVQVTYQAYSFYTDLTNKSLEGCGGDIQWSAALLLY